MQNQGGQNSPVYDLPWLESRGDIHTQPKVADSMYHRDTCRGQTKARPDARDVPVKYANKAKRIEAFANHDKK